MNKLISALLIISISAACCMRDDEPKDKVMEIRAQVSSETGITYSWTDEKKEFPIECMLVMMPEYPGVWQPMYFGSIEGFTYERGHEYYLSVRKTILADPPADGSAFTYSLIEILMDRLVVEPEVPVDKEVNSIDDIEWQESCPFAKYAAEPLYYVDGEGKITYSSGDSAPSYKNARLYIEDVLPKDDPDWKRFQHIPYQATYSYVFSPLSDKVRLVRNESSGPMFKNVVPEDEFKYIVESLTENEELQYTLVLANVQKFGLQKLTFAIRKK